MFKKIVDSSWDSSFKAAVGIIRPDSADYSSLDQALTDVERNVVNFALKSPLHGPVQAVDIA